MFINSFYLLNYYTETIKYMMHTKNQYNGIIINAMKNYYSYKVLHSNVYIIIHVIL